jgi:3-oxoacyl-[acyl-carrier protein] reductase
MMMNAPDSPSSQFPSAGLLKGKRAIITGGSRGIGKALCAVFAREGALVAFNYNNNDEAAQDTLRLIEAHGSKGKAFKVSVTDRDGIKNMVKELTEEWGGIDILINNAAINKADNFVTTTEASWHSIIDTNVNGLYYMTKPVLKQMMKQRKGNIVNITSIAAQRCMPTSVHYSTSKAAVVGFTKGLAREAVGFGITVNAIAAGMFNTDLGHSLPEKLLGIYTDWVPKGRLGNPEDLAEFAVFLASDRNTYMQGEVVTIDGGATV